MRISAQAVGALGEWSAVTELLRRGWIPANINGTVKNAASFDVYAMKNGCHVSIRVRACQPGTSDFQFGGFEPNKPVEMAKFEKNDFTVLVCPGVERREDRFFVLPSKLVRAAIMERQQAWMSKRTRKGTERKDSGHWTIHLKDRKDGIDEGGWGYARKWAKYLNNWEILEDAVP